MEIILTENQLRGFIENQKIILSFWNRGLSVDEINKYTSIPKGFVYQSIRDEPYKIPNCDVAYGILMDLLDYRVVETTYKKNDIFISTDLDVRSGSLYFTYNSGNSRVDGIATPFWDGNCLIPIDWGVLVNGDNVEGYFSEPITYRFKTIGELIDWFNTDYYEILIKHCEKLIKMYSRLTS